MLLINHSYAGLVFPMDGRAFRVLTWSEHACQRSHAWKLLLIYNLTVVHFSSTLVHICHVHQVAIVFRGTPALVVLVSRPALLGWETLGQLLTLRPGRVLRVSPSRVHCRTSQSRERRLPSFGLLL